MSSALPLASLAAAAAHQQTRWTSPRVTPLLPMTTMLLTLSSLRPRPRTKTRTLGVGGVRRRVRRRICGQCHCRQRRAIALPPPPQPSCCCHRAAAVALCAAAALRAAATAADAAMLTPTLRCRAAATAAASALLPPRCLAPAVRESTRCCRQTRCCQGTTSASSCSGSILSGIFVLNLLNFGFA